MNAQEFSSEFDIYFNNVSSNQAPGLNEYEKSVLLTNAQYEILKNYFTPVQGGNKYQQGFEDSKKRDIDFSSLISTIKSSPRENVSQDNLFDVRGKLFDRPSDMFIPVSEVFYTSSVSRDLPQMDFYQVVPVKYDEYQRLMSKPSTDPLRRQVWKISGANVQQLPAGCFEIIPHWKDALNTNNFLVIKYIRKPYPIILENLQSQGLSIEGVSVPFGEAYTDYPGRVCELPDEIHKEILVRAVEIAKITYLGDVNGLVSMGQRSE